MKGEKFFNKGEVKHFSQYVSSGRFSSIDKVVSFGWHRVNKNYDVRHDEPTACGLLLLTISGKGRLWIKDKEYTLTEGAVAVLPKGSTNRYCGTAEGDWEFYWIYYGGDHADKLVSDIVGDKEYLFNIGAERIERYCAMIGDERGALVSREIREAEALESILRRCLRRAVSAQYKDGETDLINSILMRFDGRSEAVSLDELSYELHYSKEYIIRLFKKATGMTPYHYAKVQKLRYACTLLVETEDSVSQVAQECGYSHAESFAAEFKKLFGVSPTQYRKQYKLS